MNQVNVYINQTEQNRTGKKNVSHQPDNKLLRHDHNTSKQIRSGLIKNDQLSQQTDRSIQ